MTEEEYFRKNFPDSCYGDEPLSPYWDYFQYGVEFGERQSEKEIRMLKSENAELKELLNCENCCELEESECGSCAEFGHFRCKGKGQLTKAKELLKRWVNSYGYIDVALCNQTDRFISEVEK